MAPPRRFPDLSLNAWPDYLEIYRDEETGAEEFHFITVRKNTRSFTLEQVAMMEALERIGAKVWVRFGTSDVSLQEFQEGGFQSKSISKQQGYNLTAEIKHISKVLGGLSKDHPHYQTFVSRLNKLKERQRNMEMLVQNPERVKTSDAELDQLVKQMKAEEIDLTKDPKIMNTHKLDLENQIQDQRVKLGTLKEFIEFNSEKFPTETAAKRAELKQEEDWLEELNHRLDKLERGQ